MKGTKRKKRGKGSGETKGNRDRKKKVQELIRNKKITHSNQGKE